MKIGRMLAEKARKYVTPDLLANIRLDSKTFPGTNTQVYSASSSATKKEFCKFDTLSQCNKSLPLVRPEPTREENLSGDPL
jgi:hypothetical protein